MPKSEDEYAAALEPGPANTPNVEALDESEALIERDRKAARAAAAAHQATRQQRNRRGPDTNT